MLCETAAMADDEEARQIDTLANLFLQGVSLRFAAQAPQAVRDPGLLQASPKLQAIRDEVVKAMVDHMRNLLATSSKVAPERVDDILRAVLDRAYEVDGQNMTLYFDPPAGSA